MNIIYCLELLSLLLSLMSFSLSLSLPLFPTFIFIHITFRLSLFFSCSPSYSPRSTSFQLYQQAALTPFAVAPSSCIDFGYFISRKLLQTVTSYREESASHPTLILLVKMRCCKFIYFEYVVISTGVPSGNQIECSPLAPVN